jgi:hypothetical protein
MKLIFWLSALVTVYSYFLYAAVLALWPQRRELRRGEADWQPSVSLIITAYNEEGRIADKLNNALALDYPLDRLDIIVASDCSGDDTDRIVGDYAARGVRLVRADERKGKEYAQYCAIQQAENDILVFSDVATEMPRDALQLLVSYFADPSVGAVSSEDRFVSQDGSIAGEGAYVKYEMWLRRQESRLAGLVGLSGSFFAVRASVCEQWDIYSPSDFNTALNCARSGLIAVTAPDVLGFYKDIVDGKGEYQRKVRTVLRGMTALVRHPEVLNPCRFGMFALQLWSHKVMRWAVPWAMLMLLISSVALWQQGWIYQVALILQVAFYGAGLLSWLCSPVRSFGPLRIVFFFLQVNLALAQAFLKLISGKRIYVWQPSER